MRISLSASLRRGVILHGHDEPISLASAGCRHRPMEPQQRATSSGVDRDPQSRAGWIDLLVGYTIKPHVGCCALPVAAKALVKYVPMVPVALRSSLSRQPGYRLLKSSWVVDRLMGQSIDASCRRAPILTSASTPSFPRASARVTIRRDRDTEA